MKLLVLTPKKIYGVIELENNKITNHYTKNKDDQEYSIIQKQINDPNSNVLHYLDKCLLFSHITTFNEDEDIQSKISIFYLPSCNDLIITELTPCCGNEGLMRLICGHISVISEIKNNLSIDVSDRNIILSRMKSLFNMMTL